MPTVAAAMMAAGYSAPTAIAGEGATWVAPPAAYYAWNKYAPGRLMDYGTRYHDNRGKKKSFVYKMPYGSKRSFSQMQLGDRPRYNRNSKYRKAPMYRPVASYHDPKHDHDNKWVNIRDIKTLTVGNSVYLGSIGLHDLQSAPIFKKFSILYGLVRCKKIKIEFNEGMYSHQVLTAVSILDANDPASQDEMLKEPSLHIHNLGASRGSKYPPSRTFNLFQANKDFTDWTQTETSNLNSELGTEATPGSKKAVIKYAFTPTISSNTRVEVTISYLCEFCSLNDITSVNGQTL